MFSQRNESYMTHNIVSRRDFLYGIRMSRIARIALILFGIGGIVLLLGDREWFPDFYHPRFMGVGSFVWAIIVYVPAVAFRSSSPNIKTAAQQLQSILAVLLLLSSAGSLGLWQLYRIGFEYDKIVHFLFPAASVYGGVGFLAALNGWPVRKSVNAAILIVLVCAVGWEFFEFFGDELFGTEMWGMYDQGVVRDTIVDLLANLFGIVTGAYMVRRNFNAR